MPLKNNPQPTDLKVYERIKEQVKASVARWPSAYASGMLVKRYKAFMESKGLEAYMADGNQKSPSTLTLTRWFLEKWIDLETLKPCGSAKSIFYYPTCRPTVRISAKTPKTVSEYTEAEKQRMIKAKQAARNKTVNYKALRS